MIEGPTLVLEALAAGIGLDHVLVEPGAPGEVVAAVVAGGVDCFEVPHGTLAGALDLVAPQPVVAVAELPAPAPLPEPGRSGTLVLVLDAIGDPGNAGTLLRTAEAAGAEAVVVGAGSVDPWAPKVVRAAAGSTFRLPVHEAADLPGAVDRLRAAGARCIASAVAGTPYDELDLTGPVALVVSNEAHGLSAELAGRVDAVASIPMAGQVESLNAAVAGAVLAFEAARQRRAAGAAGGARS